MTGAELKAQARAQLGGGIFKNEWLTALAVCFIAMAICSAAVSLQFLKTYPTSMSFGVEAAVMYELALL